MHVLPQSGGQVQDPAIWRQGITGRLRSRRPLCASISMQTKEQLGLKPHYLALTCRMIPFHLPPGLLQVSLLAPGSPHLPSADGFFISRAIPAPLFHFRNTTPVATCYINSLLCFGSASSLLASLPLTSHSSQPPAFDAQHPLREHEDQQRSLDRSEDPTLGHWRTHRWNPAATRRTSIHTRC